jgi:pyridoxal phosphate enzyme (YggS family)
VHQNSLMNIKENILQFNQLLEGTGCQLVAVSKTKPAEFIKKAYDAGQKDFGENKVQELRQKPLKLPNDIRWHMIGHLQTNKVKYIAPFIHLIHAVDSLKLLKEIEKQAKKNNRIIRCLLQIHIADEESKYGMSESALNVTLSSEEFKQMQHVKVVGLMGMATYTDNKEQVRREFKTLKQLFEKTKKSYQAKNIDMAELSMGMSDDFNIAIEEGSTIIRVGSKIFGSREKLK